MAYRLRKWDHHPPLRKSKAEQLLKLMTPLANIKSLQGLRKMIKKIRKIRNQKMKDPQVNKVAPVELLIKVELTKVEHLIRVHPQGLQVLKVVQVPVEHIRAQEPAVQALVAPEQAVQ